MRKLVVKILEKLGLYRWAVKYVARLKHYKMARAVRKHGLETLVSMDEAFTEMGAQMFLIYGTLLGAYRDHNFIPYDFDLDAGVLEDQLPDNYQSIILKHGFRMTCQNYEKETGRVIEETYEKNGVGIDIYFTRSLDENTYGIFSPRKHEFKEWRSANATDGFPVECQLLDKCGFVRTDFLGHQFYFPEKVTDWLKDIYTETYMTPIKNFDDMTPKRRMIYPVEFRTYRRFEIE